MTAPAAAPRPTIEKNPSMPANGVGANTPSEVIFDDSSMTSPVPPIGRPLSVVAGATRQGGSPMSAVMSPGGGGGKPDSNSMLGTTPLLDLGRFVPGTMLGQRYRIAGRLGKGGMGEVYRADDLKLGQPVAMKFLPEELSQDQAALTRLINEVKIARQVSHPNVCRVYDIGDMDGLHFISMEYVDGEDLGTLLRRIGRLPNDKALQLARQMCAGLQAAHEKGVLHRDLKPANIMIDGRGAVRLMDFGLAGLAKDLEKEGSRAGTPAYMAPEQLHGRGVTARSDIYSLGLVLYEVFTGRPAYRPSSMSELVQLHSKPLPGLRTIVADIPEPVDEAVMRAIVAEPAGRHASVIGLAASLGGQDPLAAALAAGEMPSPELVAASGGRGTLTMPIAASILAAIVAGLLVIAAMAPKLRIAGVENPVEPPTLARLAEAVLTPSLPSMSQAPGSVAYGFIEQRVGGEGDSAGEKALRFWYRRAQDPLIPAVSSEPVGPDHPARDKPGAGLVILDSKGAIVRLEVSPIEAPPGGTPNWSEIIKTAAVPKDEPRKSEPAIVPRVPADQRAAWEWTLPDGSITRCEAASLGKTPVYLEVFPRYKPPVAAASQDDGRLNTFLTAAMVSGLVYGGPIVLAVYNLRLGRGDRRGAMRLALGAFIVSILEWFLRTRLIADAGLVAILPGVAGDAMFWAALLWVLYIGIEPFIRQAWPQSLISWSRLLSGDVRDGLVGRDVLFGVGLGVAWSVFVQILHGIGSGDTAAAGKIAPLSMDARSLDGFKTSAGIVLDALKDAVLLPLVILLLVPLVRSVVKQKAAAEGVVFIVLAFAFVVVLTLQTGKTDSVGLGMLIVGGFLAAGVGTYVISRLGALALMGSFLAAGVISRFPITLNSDAWYFPRTLLAFAVLLGLAGYGFRLTVAKRKMPTGWSS